MRKHKSCYDELVEKAAQPCHPSRQGYLPVIMLSPQPDYSWMSIGYFMYWAKPDGSDFIKPEEELSANSCLLHYGGYNFHQPNAGAISIDPEQLQYLVSSRHRDFPLPAPTLVTKEGEPDLAPLLAAHLGQSLWSEAAFEDPLFTTSSRERDCNYWTVQHAVYHGTETAPVVNLIAMMDCRNCTPDRRKAFQADYCRITTRAIVDHLKAMHGRTTSKLSREVYYQK